MSGKQNKRELEEGLCAINGATSAEVDLGSGHAVVECSEEIGLDVFAAVVEEAGCLFVWDKNRK